MTVKEAMNEKKVVPGSTYINLRVEENKIVFPKELTGYEEEQVFEWPKDSLLCRLEKDENGRIIIASHRNIKTPGSFSNVCIKGFTGWKNYHIIADKICQAVKPTYDVVEGEIKPVNLAFLNNILTEKVGPRKFSKQDLSLVREMIGEEMYQEIATVLSESYFLDRYENAVNSRFYGGEYWYNLADTAVRIESQTERVRLGTMVCMGRITVGGYIDSIDKQQQHGKAISTGTTQRFWVPVREEAEISNIKAAGSLNDPFELRF